MKIFAILMLSCLSVLASDEGVHMTSVLSTNAEGIVHLEETFTRDGETNLVRKTSLKNGVVTGRIQRFYQHGEFVAVHLWVDKPENMARESFSTPPSSCTVSLHFSPKKEMEALSITGKQNRSDGFYATNGVFYPVRDAASKTSEGKK